ncbi:hypothetical protein [Variovorax sp. HJSM1_2]|uniref:hypothetical protein n=1 Tax=Variovorax sp. HJSM1_2 TaxID=3366263 RepID=UPI003BDDB82B
METEVAPQVLTVINEERLSGAKLTPVDIIVKMGVFDGRERAYEHAWLASGDIIIATVWGEHVSLGAEGQWFSIESLDPQQRIGGGTRSPSQAQRATDRIALLRRAFKEEKTFRAVLQTNRVAIAELETDKAAKVSTRVRDPEEWHVAAWEGEQQIAVLVRGPRGWMPSADEIQAARARCGIPALDLASLEAAKNVSQDELQSAAIEYVTKHFRGYGYKAENVAEQNTGVHIEVSNNKGAMLLKVAIKGVSRGVPSFRLTPEELAGSKREPLWRLLVVNDALGAAPTHKIFKPAEIHQAEGYDPQ